MVTPQDIATALQRSAPDVGSPEYLQWQMWISDAELLIDARLGDITALDVGKLNYVIREAVVAQVRRPDDATSVSISVDDGNVQRQYRSGSGRVKILDEWWDLLSPATADGAFSISMAPAITGWHADICAINVGATYCSCGAWLTLGAPLYEV